MRVEIVKSSDSSPSSSSSSPDSAEVEGLFAGMFTTSAGRAYAVDRRNVYEMQFHDQEDKIVFRSVVRPLFPKK